MMAAGVGGRAGCAAEDVLAALERALSAAGARLADVHALYTADFKAHEAGLLEAARRLDKRLIALPIAWLSEHEAAVRSPSPQASARFGLASVAETAALAGAAQLAETRAVRLLAPRARSGGATCALAVAVEGAVENAASASEAP